MEPSRWTASGARARPGRGSEAGLPPERSATGRDLRRTRRRQMLLLHRCSYLLLLALVATAAAQTCTDGTGARQACASADQTLPTPQTASAPDLPATLGTPKMGDTAAAAEDEHAATTAAAANPSASASDDLLMTNLAAATRIAIEASFVALGAWGKVVLLLSQAASRGAVVAYPTVRRLTIKAATAFAAQPRNAIAAEVGALVVLLLLWRLVRFCRRQRYVSRFRAAVRQRVERFHAGVQRRSRALAAALPHVAYAGACVATSHLADRLGLRPRLLEAMLAALPALSTGLPAVRTLLALSRTPPSEQQHDCLRYWVVWAGASLAIGLVRATPFALRLLNRVAPAVLGRYMILEEAPFYAYLWLQLPGRRGLRVAYGLLAPAIQKRASTARSLLPALPDRATHTLEFLLATALGLERRAALSEAVHEAGVLVGGAVTLLLGLSSSIIGDVGLLLLALGGPMLRSIEALGGSGGGGGGAECVGHERAGRRRGGGGGGAGGGGGVGDRGGGGGGGAGSATMPTQLRYWLHYALLCGALRTLAPALRWLPFASQWQLLCVLWLQLPIFRAATRLAAPVLRTLVPPMLRLGHSRIVATPERAPRANALYSSRLATHGGTGGAAPAGGANGIPAPPAEPPQDDEGETAPTNGDGAKRSS